MCGIVGLAGMNASPADVRARIAAMAARIAHRGPDGGGIVVHPDAALGMTRLAIVDVAHGGQPMLSDDGSVVIVYNGEIYNAPAIRQELVRKGVRFQSRSDTEVILRLYENDPDRVEERLVGMWAFAVHDRRRRRLVLSRDRFGIKPLFVADTGTAVAFASELRCFDRSAAPFSRLFSIDHDAAHAMMSWSYVPESSTIYQGVRRLPPATRLTVDLASGRRTSRCYWRLEPSDEAARVSTLDEACEHVDTLLRRAVREHLESDVPVATFLSGGIDSSLVSFYAREQSAAPIRGYSIAFVDPSFDESPFAREVGDRLGIPVVVQTFDEESARTRVADALLAYDEPFGDSSSLAMYLLAAHVSRDFKVALGGDGGDEVFGGYKKYMVVHLRRALAGQPAIRNAVGRAFGCIGRLPGSRRNLGRWTELLRRSDVLGQGLAGSDAHVYARLTQWLPLARTAPLVRRPMSVPRFEEEARDRFERAHGTELQKTLAADLGSMLCNDMLVKVDRASMACSLEARVPFLDHRLVEFGVGLPEEFTIGPPQATFRGKRVLRALYRQRFGPVLARRPKRGFSVPVQKWLQGPFDHACERLFAKDRLDRFGILSSAELSEGRFRRWVSGTEPWVAWYAFALAAWCEATLGNGPDAVRELLDTPQQRSNAVGVTTVSGAAALP